MITINGVSRPICSWAKISGVNGGTIQQRVDAGKTGEDLIAPPGTFSGGRTPKKIEYNGLSLSAAKWAEKIGITRSCLYQRFSNGWTIGQALGFDPSPLELIEQAASEKSWLSYAELKKLARKRASI